MALQLPSLETCICYKTVLWCAFLAEAHPRELGACELGVCEL